jgi:hypothetical protein
MVLEQMLSKDKKTDFTKISLKEMLKTSNVEKIELYYSILPHILFRGRDNFLRKKYQNFLNEQGIKYGYEEFMDRMDEDVRMRKDRQNVSQSESPFKRTQYSFYKSTISSKDDIPAHEYNNLFSKESDATKAETMIRNKMQNLRKQLNLQTPQNGERLSISNFQLD